MYKYTYIYIYIYIYYTYTYILTYIHIYCSLACRRGTVMASYHDVYGVGSIKINMVFYILCIQQYSHIFPLEIHCFNGAYYLYSSVPPIFFSMYILFCVAMRMLYKYMSLYGVMYEIYVSVCKYMSLYGYVSLYINTCHCMDMCLCI